MGTLKSTEKYISSRERSVWKMILPLYIMMNYFICKGRCSGYGGYDTTHLFDTICDEGGRNPYSRYAYLREIFQGKIGKDREERVLQNVESYLKNVSEVDAEDKEIYTIIEEYGNLYDDFRVISPFILLSYDNIKASIAGDDSFFITKTLITPSATISDWDKTNLEWKNAVFDTIKDGILTNMGMFGANPCQISNMSNIFVAHLDGLYALLCRGDVHRLLRDKFGNDEIDWEKMKEVPGSVFHKLRGLIVSTIKSHWDKYTTKGSRLTYMQLIYNIHIDIVKDILPGIDKIAYNSGGKAAKWITRKLVNVVRYHMAVQLFSIMLYTELFEYSDTKEQDPKSRNQNVDIIMGWICTRKFGTIASMDKNKQTILGIQNRGIGKVVEFFFMMILYQIFLDENVSYEKKVEELGEEIKKINEANKKEKGKPRQRRLKPMDICDKYFPRSKRFGVFNAIIDSFIRHIWIGNATEMRRSNEKNANKIDDREVLKSVLSFFSHRSRTSEIDSIYEKALRDIRSPPEEEKEEIEKTPSSKATGVRKNKKGGRKKERKTTKEEKETEEEENEEEVHSVSSPEVEKVVVSPKRTISVCNLLWVTERVANWLCSPKELLGYFKELYRSALSKHHENAEKYKEYSEQPLSSIEYQQTLHNHQAVMDVFSKVKEWKSYFHETPSGYSARGILIDNKGMEYMGTLQVGICSPSHKDQIALEFKKRAVKECLKRGIISQKEYNSIFQNPFGEDSVVYHLYFQPSPYRASRAIHFNQYTNWSSKINAERSLEEEIKRPSSSTGDTLTYGGLLYEIHILKDSSNDCLDMIRIEYFNQKQEKISTLIILQIHEIFRR